MAMMFHEKALEVHFEIYYIVYYLLAEGDLIFIKRPWVVQKSLGFSFFLMLKNY